MEWPPINVTRINITKLDALHGLRRLEVAAAARGSAKLYNLGALRGLNLCRCMALFCGV